MMRRLLYVILYLLAGLPVGFVALVVSGIMHAGRGDGPSWLMVVLCWLFWPIAALYGIGFFIYANVT